MDSPLISVIIPAYNIDSYVKDCVNSVLSQEYQNYEIILVNDGSTDNTPKICDQLEKAHPNIIKVLHHKNAGLSAARNNGIKRARGEYLAFIDGDDLVAKRFLSTLYEALEKTNSDIAVCGFHEFDKDNLPKTTKTATKMVTYDRVTATSKLLVGQENIDIIACNKLYKKAVFKNITFPVGELHEDNLTTYKLYAAAKQIVVVDVSLYYYRQRSSSITAKQDVLARLKQKERAAKESIAYFKDDIALKQAAEVSYLLSLFGYLDNIAAGRIENKGLWKETVLRIQKLSKTYRHNPFLTRKLKLYLKLVKVPSLYRIFRKIKN